MFADLVRVVIVVEAFALIGMTAWFVIRTQYVTGKMVLIGIVLISLGSIFGLVSQLGRGWTWNLAFSPFGYGLAAFAVMRWLKERGIMAHDPWRPDDRTVRECLVDWIELARSLPHRLRAR